MSGVLGVRRGGSFTEVAPLPKNPTNGWQWKMKQFEDGIFMENGGSVKCHVFILIRPFLDIT